MSGYMIIHIFNHVHQSPINWTQASLRIIFFSGGILRSFSASLCVATVTGSEDDEKKYRN